MPRLSNPTPSEARTSPTFTGRLRLRRRKRRLPANINSPVAQKSERNASRTQTKTSGGGRKRTRVKAPPTTITGTTKNSANQRTTDDEFGSRKQKNYLGDVETPSITIYFYTLLGRTGSCIKCQRSP